MNIKLKSASLIKDQHHYKTARNLGLRAEIFSAFISGRLAPSEDRIKKLEKYFQVNRKELGL